MNIIAEVGSVHDGSFGNALKLIELAKECGADAVKFQAHIAAAETLRDAPMPPYFQGEPRYEYFQRTGFTLQQWKELKAHADDVGIEFLSSSFSIEAVELLEEVGVRRYKIPSGEVTNIPLLERVAATGKPVLLSSGMSGYAELDAAVSVLKKGKGALTILQCTSAYPCPYEQVGLNVLQELRDRYQLPVGLSDHTLDAYSSYAAVTLGVTVIEKHLTFSRKMYGSDAAYSLEPSEFADLVRGIRAIEVMLAHPVDKSNASRFRDIKRTFENSVVSLCAIPRGTVFDERVIGCKKPGNGISARRFSEIVGKRAARDIFPDCVLREEDIV